MASPEDMKLLLKARALGYLTESEMAICLETLANAAIAGKPIRAAQLLLERKLITSGELLVALKGNQTPMPGLQLGDSAILGELAPGPTRTPLKVGDRLGEYELLREIARGGMGVLFEGRKRGSPVRAPRVAVKVMSTRASSSPQLLQRFRQEASLAASLDHPNVIRIHEVGLDRGFHFIAMDYFDGRSLAELLKTGSLAPKKAIQVCGVVAKAAGFMHERAVVHRDLKPANILVGKGGHVCVTDFGLAKDYARTDMQLTQLGVAVGTPAYMSPEQARGDLSGIGPWSDVYSIGATLYRALAGVFPFEAESFLQAVQAIANEAPPPLRQLRPDCPEDLAAIVAHAMAYSPADRPNGYELAVQLEEYLETHELLMPPAPPNRKV
jgi:serine/threonine-protein kinase